jgi:hypothetical protein
MATFKIALNMEYCRSADKSFAHAEAERSLAFLEEPMAPFPIASDGTGPTSCAPPPGRPPG